MNDIYNIHIKCTMWWKMVVLVVSIFTLKIFLYITIN